MLVNCRLRNLLTALLAAISCSSALGQSQGGLTETQIWPEVDAHWELPSQFRVLGFGGLEQGVDYPYQQWYAALALGYHFKPFLFPHIVNIDADKEHYFLFGVGYEYLRTIQSGAVKDENRITLDITPGFRLSGDFLVRDRNWLEFRWINQVYQTTYRNQLSVEHDVLVQEFHFTPYVSAEAFYDGTKHAWNEYWYTAGIQWPYKHVFMLDTYYRRENCSGCTPEYWNVAGVTFNFFFSEK